jgi:ketosteroid isomerase-like protein
MRQMLIAAASCLVVASSSVAAPAAQSNIEARLQKLEDLQAIEALIIGQYSTAIDTRDWKALGNLFTEDGVLDFVSLEKGPAPFVSYKGRDGIPKGLSGPPPANAPQSAPRLDGPPGGAPPTGAAPPGGPIRVRHIITNPTITLNGDKATATTYLSEEGRLPDGKRMNGITGHYADELRRVGGKWYIARRVIYDYDLPEKK